MFYNRWVLLCDTTNLRFILDVVVVSASARWKDGEERQRYEYELVDILVGKNPT